MNMKRWVRLIAAALPTLLLSGCLSSAVEWNSSTVRAALTVPTSAPVAVPVGDMYPERYADADIMYIDTGDIFVHKRETIRVSGAETLLTNVMTRLFTEPFMHGAQLRSAVQTSNIAIVDIEPAAFGEIGDQDMLWMWASIVQTATALPDIDYCNVLLGGRSINLGGLPGGAFGRFEVPPALIAAQRAAEEALLGDTLGTNRLERTISVYRAGCGEYLVAEARTVTTDIAGLLNILFRELQAPAGAEGMSSVFPRQAAVLTASPAIVDDGERRLVHISLNANLQEMLDEISVAPWQFFGAISLTLAGVLHDIDGIFVDVGGAQLTAFPLRGEMIEILGSVMEPGMFSGAVGQHVPLYFADADTGKLRRTVCAVAAAVADSPYARVAALIDGPGKFANALPVAPSGSTRADLLGAVIDGETVVVNLSAEFITRCRELTVVQERNLVYAIVNTLTEMHGVRDVRFLVNGEAGKTFGQFISIRSALMKNPGLIVASPG